MFQTSCRETQNTHFVTNNNIFFFVLENRAVYENVEKYCRAVQAANDSVAHAHCMPDT
jgi:hypothetical protein